MLFSGNSNLNALFNLSVAVYIMKILISNDDGLHAEGLQVLAEALSVVAEIKVVAPDRDRSGASSSLTLHKPLYVLEHDNGYMSLNGTPADCMHLAVNGFASNWKADRVVSGINMGSNLGDDVLYSGTIAAAIEGRFLPAFPIAVSLAGKRHFQTAAEMVLRILALEDQFRLAPRTILNINVPDLPWSHIKGIRVTRLGNRKQAEMAVSGKDPRGKPYFWLSKAGEPAMADEGTDFHAISQGYISVTPLTLDMTDHNQLPDLAQLVLSHICVQK